MEYSIKRRNQCRLCHQNSLTKILHFENIPFFTDVVTKEFRGKEFSYPLKIYFCNDCASVQTQYDFDITDYYQKYQYIASQSKFVVNYMKELVQYCKDTLKLKAGDKVVEIGCSDGYLLQLFQEIGANVLGFEAAENLCALAKNRGVNVVNTLFEKRTLNLIPKDFDQIQLLVLLHTFDHLYDPVPFIQAAKDLLCPKSGVLLLEVHDLEDIYNKKEAAVLGHEHAIYLHFDSMERFLHENGFRIIDFNFLDKAMIRESSMLVAATPIGSDVQKFSDLSSFSSKKLDQLETFQSFQKDVEASFGRLRSYIEDGIKIGRKFVSYGGGPRGVSTLAMAKLDKSHLSFVSDGNVNLQGCYVPVSGFEIRSPMDINRSEADEVIVTNYSYIEEIESTLQGFINQGGKVISVLDILSGTLDEH